MAAPSQSDFFLIFPSEQPVGIYEMNSLELFQRDREKNIKGIIAIDLLRWEP